MTRQARVHRLSMRGPDDVAPLAAAIAAGRVVPGAIVAILGKTEGNGCVNDFTRAFAVASLRAALAPHLAPAALGGVAMVMSGGTEGALAPHMLVLEAIETDAPPGAMPALAIGAVRTPALAAADLGGPRQIAMVADGVAAAMAAAGIADPADVHFVQIKCPLLTSARIAAARAAGESVATTDTLKSMGLSRGASALGVAVALGEVERARAAAARIGGDVDLWSARASTSAGVELDDHEIVVLGMSAAWSGPLAVDHAVMTDQIDVAPVAAALRRLGFSASSPIPTGERDRLVALLAKAEAGTSGRLRDRRHTMLEDSDLSSTRHARAFVAGALAGLVGHAEIFVSGGAEHQGPDGGGPVALIARRDTP
ncbi:ring-opening amidohydrolase [Siculibacillus lacustris]|uniref:Cyanuric acid amidohydrolase n=1 Tax=Siculibacillus lacustris TaxID=1549641 RepID=A0A4Q9VR50_9HYPH|nr:ring-opening amidohydrolase [Siculibacillus lacustris]TBW37359.1 ring-opening amidohydrolase [Siculibacillus lacustris]